MKIVKKITILACALALAATNVSAFAADGGASPKEEVVYVMTDAGGEVENVHVVNIFSGGDVTDYGDYSSVKMLTTTDAIAQNGDEITFSSDAKKVYYQGEMDDAKIPWDIALIFTLDGKETAPSDLAGKSGALEIRFSITQNTACRGSFFDDYALQAALTLDGERCSRITADGATVANVGSDKQLSYTVLPGKGLDAVITADVTDFEMDAVTINAVKLNLDVEIDDEELMDMLADLMDATEKLNDGAWDVNDGAGALKDASGTLFGGASTLFRGAGELCGGIASLQSGIAAASSGLDALDAQSDALVSGSAQIKSALEAVRASLSAVSASSDDVEQLVKSSAAIKTGIETLDAGAKELQEQLGFSQYEAQMAQNGLDVEALKAGNTQAAAELSAQIGKLQTTLSQIQSVPGYEENAAELEAQIASLQTAATLLAGNNAAIGGMESYLNATGEAAGSLYSGLEELKANYGAFDTAIAKLADTLQTLTVKISQLSSAIDKLAESDTALDSGIVAYTDGVTELADGYSQMIGGAASLASGGNTLYRGAGGLSGGASALFGGATALSDGAGALADGTKELVTQTDGMDTQAQEQIDDMLALVNGKDTKTTSFASEKNTNVQSVQFVMKTAEIKQEEEDNAPEEEEQELTFWQKFVQLFQAKEN